MIKTHTTHILRLHNNCTVILYYKIFPALVFFTKCYESPISDMQVSNTHEYTVDAYHMNVRRKTHKSTKRHERKTTSRNGEAQFVFGWLCQKCRNTQLCNYFPSSIRMVFTAELNWLAAVNFGFQNYTYISYCYL